MRTDLQLNPWSIVSSSAVGADSFLESVFFTGNGRMGVRGYCAYDTAVRPADVGMFVAGVFDEIKPKITDFVNLPTPVWESIVIDGSAPVVLPCIERILDLSQGLLTIKYVLEAAGKRLTVEQSRFFPLQQPALLVQQTKLTPDQDMELVVISGVYTACCNCPVPDDQVKENKETVKLTELVTVDSTPDGIVAKFTTGTTNITVTQQLHFASSGLAPDDGFANDGDTVGVRFSGSVVAGRTAVLSKVAEVTTGRDVDPLLEPLQDSWSYDSLRAQNKLAWQCRWNVCDVEIEGDTRAQAAIRYNVYQLVANCSARDSTVNIGARGLTHTRYKGCYFWDTDLFIVPFHLHTNPQAAHSLLQYRAATLPQAKEHAAKMNSSGARYPWMVSYDGSEQCESWDIGASELHVTADVVYAMHQYHQMTGDNEFYQNSAAAVYIETARFWQSRYSPDPIDGGVNLLFCKGPDEYCGITSNNLFTNWMVRHNLVLAQQGAKHLLEHDPVQYRKLGITEEELAGWGALHDAIKLPQDPVSGHWLADDTFDLLEPIEISKLKVDDGASYHHVCFDRLQRYKVIKQADTLLLMSRFPHAFTLDEKLNAWADFEPLCLHDSTLSFASHALFAAQNGIDEGVDRYLFKALLLDLQDIMGNTGKEGLHLAGLGESWQAVTLGLSGLSFLGDSPQLAPRAKLPFGWRALRFSCYYRGRLLRVAIKQEGDTCKAYFE